MTFIIGYICGISTVLVYHFWAAAKLHDEVTRLEEHISYLLHNVNSPYAINVAGSVGKSVVGKPQPAQPTTTPDQS